MKAGVHDLGHLHHRPSVPDLPSRGTEQHQINLWEHWDLAQDWGLDSGDGEYLCLRSPSSRTSSSVAGTFVFELSWSSLSSRASSLMLVSITGSDSQTSLPSRTNWPHIFRQIFDNFENESHLCRRFTVFVTKYSLMSKDNLIVPMLESDSAAPGGESEA